MHQCESTEALWWTMFHTHTTRQGLCKFSRGVTWYPAWCLTSRFFFPASSCRIELCQSDAGHHLCCHQRSRSCYPDRQGIDHSFRMPWPSLIVIITPVAIIVISCCWLGYNCKTWTEHQSSVINASSSITILLNVAHSQILADIKWKLYTANDVTCLNFNRHTSSLLPFSKPAFRYSRRRARPRNLIAFSFSSCCRSSWQWSEQGLW